jgi:hypothetical protein
MLSKIVNKSNQVWLKGQCSEERWREGEQFNLMEDLSSYKIIIIDEYLPVNFKHDHTHNANYQCRELYWDINYALVADPEEE